MLRVLHILDHSLPLHSGYTFRTRAILKAQEAAGLSVRGLTSQRHNLASNHSGDNATYPAIEEVDGLQFVRTPGHPGGLPLLGEAQQIRALASAIERECQAFAPDIIHAHSPALCGAAAALAAQRAGVPLVYEIRAFWEDAAVGNQAGAEGSAKYRLTRALETRVARRADAVFTICHGLRDDLIARGIEAGRIGVMPNGVDLSLFGEPPAHDEKLGHSLGIAPGAPVIGYIGSFYPYEGVDDLIAAMPALRERQPGARLLLVGSGQCELAWREAAARLPDPSAVILAGRVPHEAVEQYYSLIDVLVYPRKASRLTQLVTPLKPLEAMAQKRIVAASDVGGHRELVRDGDTGFLFAPDDPAACAARLAQVFEQRGNWDAMRDRALAHVRAHHDWARNVERYQPVYHHLIEKAAQRRAKDRPRAA